MVGTGHAEGVDGGGVAPGAVEDYAGILGLGRPEAETGLVVCDGEFEVGTVVGGEGVEARVVGSTGTEAHGRGGHNGGGDEAQNLFVHVCRDMKYGINCKKSLEMVRHSAAAKRENRGQRTTTRVERPSTRTM